MHRFIVSLVATSALVISSFAGPMASEPVSAQAVSSTNWYVNGTTPTGKAGLIVIDPISGQFKGSVDLPYTQYLLASPDGARIYDVVHIGFTQVYVISTASNSVIDSFRFDDNPVVTLNSDGTKLFAINSAKDRVSILDSATHSSLRTINTARYPTDAQTSPDGKTVYIVMDNSSCYVCEGAVLWAVDITTGIVKASVPVGAGPTSIAINPQGTRAYITNQWGPITGDPFYRGKTVSVVDLTTNTRLPSITVGLSPYKVVFTPDGKKAFVANQQDFTVSAIDTASNLVVKTFMTGPSTIAVSPDGSQTFLNSLTARTVSVVDNQTLTVTNIKTNWGVNPGGAVWVKKPNVISSLTTKPTVVVLLQGIGTGLTTDQAEAFRQGCGSSKIFNAVVNALLDVGFKCSDLLLYSYAGGTLSADSSRRWIPNPYDCSHTVNFPTSLDVTTLQTMISLYRQSHPEMRFVLLGHSLGGYIAFQAGTDNGIQFGSIPAVLTIDSPLNHATAQNLIDVRQVVPFSTQISEVCAGYALLGSQPATELADLTNANRQAVKDLQIQLVARGHSQGIVFFTVGNEQDCLWNLTPCKLPRRTLMNTVLSGGWRDDSQTMVVDNADTHFLYPLGTAGCNLSFVQVQVPGLGLICLRDSHGIALGHSWVLDDIKRFLIMNLN